MGDLWQVIDGYRVRCTACAHRCPIPAGHAGVCKVRFHRDRGLYVPWGYVVNAQCERIEKKPFFHALPGALTLSFGMLGCSLHCPYCQNWVISQTLRDPHSGAWPKQTSPEALAKAAIQHDCEAIISTYNEPLITAEWAVEVFKSARAAGLVTGFVYHGYVTPEVLEYLRSWVDLFKVDFKTLGDRCYHEMGCRLAPILEGLRLIHQNGLLA